MVGSASRRNRRRVDDEPSDDMKILRVVSAATALLLLGACATVPSGPSLMALPGSGKDFNDFRRDELQCRRYASQSVGGLSDDPAVRSAVVGTAVGAVSGAAIGGRQGAGVGAGAGLLFGSVMGADATQTYGSQRQYDQTYIQCMYAKGHRVPVSAEFARSLTVPRGELPPATGNYPPPPPIAPPASPPADYFPPPPPPR